MKTPYVALTLDTNSVSEVRDRLRRPQCDVILSRTAAVPEVVAERLLAALDTEERMLFACAAPIVAPPGAFPAVPAIAPPRRYRLGVECVFR